MRTVSHPAWRAYASPVGAVVLVLVLAVAVSIETFDTAALVADVCYVGVLLVASVVAWVGVRRWPRDRRLTPQLIAAGVSLNTVGEAVWAVLARNGGETDVSIADVFWFASYILLCAALCEALRRSRNGRVDLAFIADAVTIVVVSVLVFWRFTVDAIVEDDTVSAGVRAVWSSYPVLDAVLLALVARILISRRGRAAVDGWFALGVVLWLVADVLYLRFPDEVAAVRVMNAAWMLAPVAMAHAAWRVPRTRVVAGPEVESGYVARLLIAVGPLLVPPLLDVIADLRGQPDEPYQLLIGTAVLITLALVRTGRLIRSEQRALRELVVARDAALAASQAKSMFLATVSHEIRTPLTTVLGTAELLRTGALDDRQLKLLDMMRRSGSHLLALVESILDFSRLRAGQAVLNPEQFDLHALAAQVGEAHVARARARGVDYVWEVASDVPCTVVGDPTRVVQVLDNLLVNAMKFTEAGRVHLGVTTLGPDGRDGVRFTVSDTGIGIREEDQASVFEQFSQVDASATRRYEGTGLGLAICKELTDLMGGSIALDSAPGAGSTFTVDLPLVAVTAPEPSLSSVALHA